MRNLALTLAIAITAATPALAQNYENGRWDRYYASPGEVERSRDRVRDERDDVREARRNGDRRDIRSEQRDVERARREYQRDARDFNNARRNDARYWNTGRNYNWNRPDPRYNGYYANNYYRQGNYQPVQLGANDRIFRGQDNRYYCRRGDGTTGLIVGAIGGGVLGNAIAPGGSKTLGSILGGSLGAILGNSIGRGNVTCR